MLDKFVLRIWHSYSSWMWKHSLSKQKTHICKRFLYIFSRSSRAKQNVTNFRFLKSARTYVQVSFWTRLGNENAQKQSSHFLSASCFSLSFFVRARIGKMCQKCRLLNSTRTNVQVATFWVMGLKPLTNKAIISYKQAVSCHRSSELSEEKCAKNGDFGYRGKRMFKLELQRV